MTHSLKKLNDLYLREVKVEIPVPDSPKLDENGNRLMDSEGNVIMESHPPLVFYARKMNPLQHEKAVREVLASQIALKSLHDRPTDPDYELLYEAVDSIEEPVSFIAEVEVLRQRDKMEQELSAEDEWAEENRYQSLIDAWEGEPGYKKEVTENPDPADRSKECNAVWEQMQKFKHQLEARMRDWRIDRIKTLEKLPKEDIRRMVFDVLLQDKISNDWIVEYNTQRMIYGIYDENRERLFETADDVKAAPREAKVLFKDALDRITLNTTEVKF